MKHSAIVGAIAGLLVSTARLLLLWFGVAGILVVGNTDLGQVLWPSSIMLTTGWRSTPAGIVITISSLAINCLSYAVIAAVLHTSVRRIRRSTPGRAAGS